MLLLYYYNSIKLGQLMRGNSKFLRICEFFWVLSRILHFFFKFSFIKIVKSNYLLCSLFVCYDYEEKTGKPKQNQLMSSSILNNIIF